MAANRAQAVRDAIDALAEACRWLDDDYARQVFAGHALLNPDGPLFAEFVPQPDPRNVVRWIIRDAADLMARLDAVADADAFPPPSPDTDGPKPSRTLVAPPGGSLVVPALAAFARTAFLDLPGGLDDAEVTFDLLVRAVIAYADAVGTRPRFVLESIDENLAPDA